MFMNDTSGAAPIHAGASASTPMPRATILLM